MFFMGSILSLDCYLLGRGQKRSKNTPHIPLICGPATGLIRNSENIGWTFFFLIRAPVILIYAKI